MPDRILLVDDDMAMIKSMSRMLATVADIQFACSGEDALRLVRDRPPSLILLDAEMPGMSGFQVCEQLKADPALAHIPVIFVTAHSEAAIEVAGFELGAVDFIAKPVSPPLLVARARTQLRIRHLTDELRLSATTDGLTRVANRRAFDDAFRREWALARRTGESLSALMVDADHFKLYNDHHGHAAGDRCLQGIAQALSDACLRPGDLVARYGGEEFVLLLPQTPRAGAIDVAGRVLAAVHALAIPHAASRTAQLVTVSVGVSCADRLGDAAPAAKRDLDERAWHDRPARLLQAADKALYAAKAAGRARAWFLDCHDLDDELQACEVAASPTPALAADPA